MAGGAFLLLGDEGGRVWAWYTLSRKSEVKKSLKSRGYMGS